MLFVRYFTPVSSSPHNYQNCGELLREGIVKNQISFGFLCAVRVIFTAIHAIVTSSNNELDNSCVSPHSFV